MVAMRMVSLYSKLEEGEEGRVLMLKVLVVGLKQPRRHHEDSFLEMSRSGKSLDRQKSKEFGK